MKRKRVVVAMSGGVDSSMAAALLKEQGYEVGGITMNLFSLPAKYCRSENLRSCCGWKAAEDSHRVASSLGISHYVADFRKYFDKKVIADFCEEYARGRTPNPCIRCNQYIKFDILMQKLETFEADYLATGHHARVEYDTQSGRYLLKKGRDKKKDQSYFLYPLSQEQLSRTLMPIGDFTKDEVRKKAKKLGLHVAQRPESQEICFVPDNDYVRFLLDKIPEACRPGPIMNLENKVLAQHKGIIHFTIGQRRGLGIAAPHPLYVLSIRSDKNTIIVGTNDQLYGKTLLVTRLNLISIAKISRPMIVKAKIRYKHREAKALITPLDSDQALVEFEKPQRAITPGQSVVFYDGDVVLGGGIIDTAGEKSLV
ncbi:MAG: tRNA 2-thiouridine(34) synthase MnmA [Candidatus Aminicenantes bacterium]|nr:MAG: tRNA 2-thiouridine(34) synthase MnmA [Candidatus Aminicenantes bacterium]